MKVHEILNPHVVTIGPDELVATAARMMREHHVGDLVVVERHVGGASPVGIVTDRDIVVGCVALGVGAFDRIMVRDIMARDLVLAHADEDVTHVLKKMRTHAVRRMPVVNALEVLVGIVTLDDLVRVLADELAALTKLATHQIIHEKSRRT